MKPETLTRLQTAVDDVRAELPGADGRVEIDRSAEEITIVGDQVGLLRLATSIIRIAFTTPVPRFPLPYNPTYDHIEQFPGQPEATIFRVEDWQATPLRVRLKSSGEFIVAAGCVILLVALACCTFIGAHTVWLWITKSAT